MSKLYKSVAMLLVLLLVGPQNATSMFTPGTMMPGSQIAMAMMEMGT